MRSFVARPHAMLVLVATLSLGACESDTVAPQGEPPVAKMRLTVASQQTVIDQSGASSAGSIVLRAGIPVVVTAEFLTATGEVQTGIAPAIYQLNVVVGGTQPVTFTRSTTDPFSGTIVCNVPNTVAHLTFSLYNLEKQHDLWGPFDVSFVISN